METTSDRNVIASVWARFLAALAMLVVAFSMVAAPALADPLDDLDDSPSQEQVEEPAEAPQPDPEPADNGNSDGEGSTIIEEQVRDHNPMNEATDSPAANWVLAVVGKLTSFVILLVFAFFFFVTALDLLYITAPFMRPWLSDANEDGQGNNLVGGMGGFGMNNASGTASKKSVFNRQWVSDEAVALVKSLGGSSQSQMGGMGAGFGGGFGGAGFGGPGMGTGQPQQDANDIRSVLPTYFRKRVVIMIMLGICVTVLTSSAIFGFGFDVGTFLIKVAMAAGAWVRGQDPSAVFG